jgi:hypothetical protein
MPHATRHRAAAVLLIFAIAAAAGWFTASPPGDEMNRRIPAPIKPPAVPAVPTAAAAPSKNRDAAIAALERAFALSLDPAAEVYSGERLMEWCRGDFPSDLPGGSDEACAFANQWAAKDPEGMFEWFLSQGRFTLEARGTSCNFLGTIFQGWANKDSGAAAAAALRCPSKREQGEARAAILEALSDASFSLNANGKELAEKWTFLCGLPVGRSRATILARYFDEVTRYHAAESERLWREAPVDIRRELIAGGFTASWAGHDDKASDKPPSFDGLADLHRQYAEENGDCKDARHFLNAHGNEWAQSDPAAAVAWSLAHLKGEQRVQLTAQLFFDAASHDFDAAVDAWQALPDGILKARAAGNMVSGAPENRRAEMDEFLSVMPPSDLSEAEEARKRADGMRRLRATMEEHRMRLQRP